MYQSETQPILPFYSPQNTLTFHQITNNSWPECSQKLLAFKSIIAKALPNMDKTHIVRLLFDKRHLSIVAYEGSKLVGGVCYAKFRDLNGGEELEFVEVAFLAVRAEKRVQGYGRKIINKLKAHLQSKKIKYILTYGDNMALGFFRKQGFSEKITLPHQRWQGYIKQYDGGKLMQCKIHPTVNYMEIDSIIRRQKEYVRNLIKNNSSNGVLFLGAKIGSKSEVLKKEGENEVKEQGQKMFQRKNLEGIVQVFRRDPRSIPGVIQSGWDWSQHDQLKKLTTEPFQIRCKKLLQQIKKHPESKYFLQPVSIKQFPTYYTIIQTPMSLNTMSQKIANEQYKNQQHYCSDIELIFSNCKKFNPVDSVYYRSAVKLKELIGADVSAFRCEVIGAFGGQNDEEINGDQGSGLVRMQTSGQFSKRGRRRGSRGRRRGSRNRSRRRQVSKQDSLQSSEKD